MVKRRNPRVDHAVRQAIADILADDIRDPRVKLISITEVATAMDGDSATVWYSIIDPDVVTAGSERRGGDHLPTEQDVAAGLEAAKGRIRTLLGQRVKLRHTPLLKFVHDPVQEASSHVEALLRNLRDDR